MNQYFSDFFEVSPEVIEAYGAFNISLISDLPLFIDPFLLFNSEKPEYQELHNGIIEYLRFLRRKAGSGALDTGLINAWFRFPEIKQNWFGFSIGDNRGSGLGKDFAQALHMNLYKVFSDFGTETVTLGSHLEKLCLVSTGVGKDSISDFTTNLIHGYLLDYTQNFATQNIAAEFRKTISVAKARFNYETETWVQDRYDLPYYNGDYVLLTPKDILTKDETWINKPDFYRNFDEICLGLPNDDLRAEVNNYFAKVLAVDPETREPDESKKAKQDAAVATLREYPQLVDYYIRYKEENGDEAESTSSLKVKESEYLYVEQFKQFATELNAKTDFYKIEGNTLEEARQRLLFFKDVIENNDGYRFFYNNGQRLDRESDVHILYYLTWFASPSDVNREVNNGRGPVDFKISRGRRDKSLVEFKLAKNTQLRRNLEKQVEIYEAANDTKKSLKAILYFTHGELLRVEGILRDLKLDEDPNIILIDARDDNKPSASKA